MAHPRLSRTLTPVARLQTCFNVKYWSTNYNCVHGHPLILANPTHICSRRAEVLTRCASTSVWTSIIPRAIRGRQQLVSNASKQMSSKESGWNPATFYILAFLIIGSNAIQMIALRNDFQNFSRKTEMRLRLLRETIEKVRQGEELDVRKALGTGDVGQEEEWWQVVEELKAAEPALVTELEKVHAPGQTDEKASKSTATHPYSEVEAGAAFTASGSEARFHQSGRFY